MTRRSWEPAGPPIVWVRNQAAASLLASRGLDLAGVRATDHPLTATRLDVSVSFTLRTRLVSSARAPNVAGILEGSDARLKDEYVVFSAHMDHLDVARPPVRGDSIHNGADDNASGTTAVIELAEAFARLEPRPKRSMIFVTVSGEERGLWGSSAFTADPPVPMGQMVANVNLDMVGRNWKDSIVVIGRQHSDLGATLARVNAAHRELGMTAIDDLWPEERFFFRSDHYNFARLGVPALFFFNGVHEDYHKVSDEPAKIDAEKASRIVKLAFYLGLEVANAAQRPKWNPASYKQIVEGR
jgi:Zn-dependent M28 family amino/carboxypeptidase